MFEILKKIKNINDFFNQSKIQIGNDILRKAVQDYSLIYLSENYDFSQFPNIIDNIRQSKVIVIDHYAKPLSDTESIQKKKKKNL